jgi:hypothetical protein
VGGHQRAEGMGTGGTDADLQKLQHTYKHERSFDLVINAQQLRDLRIVKKPDRKVNKNRWQFRVLRCVSTSLHHYVGDKKIKQQ